jgi:hypothetical protein
MRYSYIITRKRRAGLGYVENEMEQSQREDEAQELGNVGPTALGCMQARHRVLLGELKGGLVTVVSSMVGGLTLQNLGLRNVRLARTLQRPSVDEVQHHAVWQLLSVLVGWVRCAELA